MSLSPARSRCAALACATLLSCGAQAAFAQLKISGSETLEPLFQDALNQFARGDGAGISVSASYKGSSVGWTELCAKQVAIAPSSVKMEAKAAARCQEDHVALVELPIAFDAVVVIANPRLAALGSLSGDELKNIFAVQGNGAAMRWSQVRPNMPDSPMSVVSLDPHSGTTKFFTAQITGMAGFVRPDAKTTANNADVIRMVAADPNAIGFVSMGALAESSAAVWRVPVNFGRGPVVASRESVLDGSYSKLSRLLYVYASTAALGEKDSPSRKFLAWMMDHGAKLASYENFVPLIDRNYQDNARLVRSAR